MYNQQELASIKAHNLEPRDVEEQIRRFAKGFNPLDIVAEQFPDDVLADNANYMLATIYENQLNDKQLAMQHYLKIITDYASSIFVTDSRKRYRALRGDVQ